VSTVLLLSTADTDLLAARAASASYRTGNPTRVDAAADLPALLAGADVAVVRLLGGKRAWEDGPPGFRRCCWAVRRCRTPS
jgi:cobaltochelatase CobN